MYHIFLYFFSLSPFFQEQTLVKTLVEQLCIFRDFINNTKALEAPKGSNFVTSLQQIGDDLTYPISNFQQMVSEYKELIIAVNLPLTSYSQPWKLELMKLII